MIENKYCSVCVLMAYLTLHNSPHQLHSAEYVLYFLVMGFVHPMSRNELAGGNPW